MVDRPDLPAVLAGSPSFSALATLADRLTGIDLTPLLVNQVDTVPDSALDALAEQFSLVGDGWDLAYDDDDRRAMVKRAIEIHRYKGTVWAVKAIFGTLGATVDLVEWWQQPGAAPFTFGLTAWVNDNLKPGEPVLTADLYQQLRRLVDAVKPVRSHYDFRVGVRFDQPLQIASAGQTAAVGRWSSEVQPVQPTPAQQPLRLASAGQSAAVARVSATPAAVQPTAAVNPIRLANTARPLSVIRVTMEI